MSFCHSIMPVCYPIVPVCRSVMPVCHSVMSVSCHSSPLAKVLGGKCLQGWRELVLIPAAVALCQKTGRAGPFLSFEKYLKLVL